MSAPFSSFNPPPAPCAGLPCTITSTNDSYTITQLIEEPPAVSALTAADAVWVTVTASWAEGGLQKTMPLTFIKSQNVENSYVPE